ncbi:MAG: hypothetical protein KDC48_13520 [Planctomycetes bacterium]|nr:hypothetical protein [Planctomycetota bacterium]
MSSVAVASSVPSVVASATGPGWIAQLAWPLADLRRGRRALLVVFAIYAAVMLLAVPQGIGSSWRECDTQAIARSFLVEGFDPLHPKVDWRGDTGGAVECEFPLFQLMVATVMAATGEAEWPGRVIALLSMLFAAFSLHRLLEARVGPAGALAGAMVFLTGGHAMVLGGRVQPDATSTALALAGLTTYVRFLATGSGSTLLLATLATTFGAFSGRIQNGGALAVLATGDESCGERLLLTVRATASTPPNDPQLNDLAAFPTSALTNAALLMRMTPPSPYPALGDQTARTMELSDEDQTYTRFEPDELLELLRTSLGELADTDDFSMDIAGGFLFVHAPRTTITIVGDLLRGLESRLLRNVQVRHFGTIDQGRGSAPLHELVAPSLLGRELIVVRLLETSFVRELQAEIAQESSTLEPQLETAQSGTWLRLRAANPSGETHVDMLAQTVHVRALRPRNVNPGGLLMPNDVSSCRCLHDGKAVNGKVIDHGDGPIVTLGDTPLRTTLSTIVKW